MTPMLELYVSLRLRHIGFSRIGDWPGSPEIAQEVAFNGILVLS